MRKVTETIRLQASKILEWGQQEEAVTITAGLEAFVYNRGAEQGETLGPAKPVMPVAFARKKP